MICPCGSNHNYEGCCERLHLGEVAQTPEQLMRSRYSAFVVGNVNYLLQTWHPSTRPTLNLDDNPDWQKLDILSTSHPAPSPFSAPAQEGDEGFVHFKAYYRLPENTGGGLACLEEKSRFVFENGCWFYIDGHIF
ncbi:MULTISPECIES: YchJ family protein [Gammaproteobacteria]|uniref:YchJ family protein n=1 Tax=Gammaproteobacteria TaxID=1236 RepID=UPI000DCFCECC|nr:MULTISPECIES: YchJ family metal-binding protein [Gammaproteobacteria]RTE86924.1 hypothetical protein DQX04_00610 [Aliidiomarina sp. B3213]TCZ93286.1 hypothetical protein EYQ95_04690 [Lysobacter sp. N42]